MAPGFYFSNMIQALTSKSNASYFGLLCSNWHLQAQNAWMNCLVPNFDSYTMSFPNMIGSMPASLDPGLCANSCFNAWQQYQEQMRNNGQFGGFGGSFNPSQIWGFNPSQSGGGGSSSSSTETDPEKIQKKEKYDILQPVLKKLIDKLPTGSELKAEIKAALNKSGNIEEKYEALEGVMDKVTSNENKKYLRAVLLQNDKFNEGLKKAGYEIETKNKTDEKKTIRKNIEKLRQAIDEKNADGAITIINGSGKGFIEFVSAWNDENKDKHIISKVADILKNKDNNEFALKLVTNSVHALDECVTDLQVELEDLGIKADKLIAKRKAMNEKLAEILPANNGNKFDKFNQTNLKKLSALFDDVYSMVRLMEAEIVNNKVKEEYQAVSEMLGGITNENFIVNKVKEDLKNENCKENIETDEIESSIEEQQNNSEVEESNSSEQEQEQVQEEQNASDEIATDNTTSSQTTAVVVTSTENKPKEVDNNAIANAEKLGVDMRAELYVSGTSASKVSDFLDKINTSQEMIAFVKGYNKQKSWMCQWNDKLCAKIAREKDEDDGDKLEISKDDKIDMLIRISNKFKKVINELLDNPKCSDSDKENLKEYLKNFEIISDEDDKNPEKWQTKIGFWSNMTWSFLGNPLTGVANYMDRTIDKICEIYEKLN